ncbi:TPA: DUF4435 domain-containing protein [Escherichia coli]|uniref:DUF4435 domain-containing protein n=1 Tax=Escherichia coli TaxID=562 RepID=UPI0021E974BB|nr:DUF4435 domain-containing protein [Escherichia coli]MCV2994883.1 DUF4435 domain-containing protein [Escherichia coli]MCV3098000.1 DUF4435 domain-containing protein [Escherichia coli]
MSSCAYTVDSYITSLSMSSKKRLLVEGRHDRSHLYQLIYKFNPASKVKIDTAQDIKASDKAMSKNNRLKIETIHSRVKRKDNISFLCDREFREFTFNDQIKDLLNSHYCDDSLYWTLGHSLENYFFNASIIIDAFQFLSPSEYKYKAIELFSELISSSFAVLAAISIAAKNIDKSGLPAALIDWKDIVIENGDITLVRRNAYDIDPECVNSFFNAFDAVLPSVTASEVGVCSRVVRGHTGILLLQKLFAACLYYVGREDDSILADTSANYFCNISELSLTTALAESWVRKIGVLEDVYFPESLLKDIE